MSQVQFSRSHSRSRSAVGPALLVGALTPVVFIPLDLIDGFLRPGYSITRHWVSHLALGPLGWVGTALLAVTASLVAIGAIGLLVALRRAHGKIGAAIAMLIAAVGLGMAAAFPMDASLGFPSGVTPSASTVSGLVHQAAGPIFILGMAIALLLSAGSLRSIGAPPSSAALRATGIAAIAAFLVCTVLVSLDYANVWPAAPSGLAERTAIALGLIGAAIFELRVRARVIEDRG